MFPESRIQKLISFGGCGVFFFIHLFISLFLVFVFSIIIYLVVYELLKLPANLKKIFFCYLFSSSSWHDFWELFFVKLKSFNIKLLTYEIIYHLSDEKITKIHKFVGVKTQGILFIFFEQKVYFHKIFYLRKMRIETKLFCLKINKRVFLSMGSSFSETYCTCLSPILPKKKNDHKNQPFLWE